MKMTYVELCQLIESGEQPDKITVDGLEYEWGDGDYIDEDGDDFHNDFDLETLINRSEIIVKENLLTEAERDYLKTVIKPFRYRVNSITKKRVGSVEYIAIDCTAEEFSDEAILPSSPEGTTYKQMEPNKPYTLEELDL